MATTIIDPLAPQPRLPLDVQLILAENCPDVPTLLSLISSHKTLRECGARLALQLPTARVALHTEPALYSFFHFLAPPSNPIANPPSGSRLAHLHTLDISLAIVRGTSVEGITVMFAHVPALSSLTLRDPEPTLADHAALYAALQRLTTLKALHAFGAGPATRRLFVEIASPLEDITLAHDASVLDADTSLEIETVLLPHRATLARVRATRATPFAHEDDAAADAGGESVVFENVRELAIDEFAWDAVPGFLIAFPNVVTLDVGTNVGARWRLSPLMQHIREGNKWATGGLEAGDSDDSDTEDSGGEEEERGGGDNDAEMAEREEVHGLLQMAVDDQMGEQDGAGVHGQVGENDEDEDDGEALAGEWLERVRGGLLDLYVFGNSCVVDNLIIDGRINHDWACVPAVVADHRPRVLHMSVSSSVDVDTWDWKKLASVRDLCLKVVAEGPYDEQRLMDTIERMVAAFAFCSTFCFNFVEKTEGSCPPLKSFDHKGFANRVFQASKTPTTLKLFVYTPSRVTTWCAAKPRVVDEDGSMELALVLSQEAYL